MHPDIERLIKCSVVAVWLHVRVERLLEKGQGDIGIPLSLGTTMAAVMIDISHGIGLAILRQVTDCLDSHRKLDVLRQTGALICINVTQQAARLFVCHASRQKVYRT